MKIKLKLWSKVAEIIGSIGIIISLIFVAIQYKKNSLALETSTVNSVNTNIANWYSYMGDDLSVSRVFSKFFEEPKILTPEERFQAIMKLHSLFLHLQNAYYLEKKGVLDPSIRRSITYVFFSGKEKPGFKYFWKIRKDIFTEEFQKFVDNIIQSEPDSNIEKLYEKIIN